jgi:hypothetical protein
VAVASGPEVVAPMQFYRSAGRLVDARRPPRGPGRLVDGPIQVLAGPTAWQKARALGVSVLVLPDGHDPYAYRWPVARREVAVSWPRGNTRDVRRLVDALLAEGADRVIVVDPIYYDSAHPEPWRWET